MKIEFILIGVIVLVFLIDFIVKRRKKGLIIPKQKNQFSKNKKIVYIISLLSTIATSLFIYLYNPFFVFNENNISIKDIIKYDRFYEGDVLEKNENNELTFFSKKTMEPITGIIYSKYMILGVAINGKANGTFTGFGKIENYSNGKLNGLRKVWSSRIKKTLIIESNYKNGLLNGSYKEWSNDGQLLKEVNYINDTLNGSFREFGLDGEIIAKGIYYNGLKEGEWIDYSYDYYRDIMKLKGNYLNGEKNGMWTFFHVKKGKEFSLYFKNGRLLEGENNLRKLIEDRNLADFLLSKSQ